MAEKLIGATAAIIAAYVDGNKTDAAALPALIATTYAALKSAQAPMAAPEESSALPTAAQIRKSIRPEALISFIDRKPYRTLKRHLSTNGLTPVEYRARFGLPNDYPMVAPAYTAKRSELAKRLGLGHITGGRKSSLAPGI